MPDHLGNCGDLHSSHHIIYNWEFNASFSNEQPANGLWSEAQLFTHWAELQARKKLEESLRMETKPAPIAIFHFILLQSSVIHYVCL